MFSRSPRVLASRLPPFATFYKSMSGTLVKTPTTQRMRVAGALWRKTAPEYGIFYSAPRVAAAKGLFMEQGTSVIETAPKAAAKTKRRVPHSRRAKKANKTGSTRKIRAAARKAPKIKRSKQAPRRYAKASARKSAPKKPAAPTPYAAFTSKVMKQAKLAPTATNTKRVFRMWLMTGQQRSMPHSSRVNMAVRLLTKDTMHRRKLSKKATKKTASKRTARKYTKRARKTSPKKSTGRRLRMAIPKSKVRKLKAGKKVGKKAGKKPNTTAKNRKAARKLRKAPKKASKGRTSAKTKALARRTRKQRGGKKAAKSAAGHHHRHHKQNPYIDFYRRIRMTGLIPNSPVVVGSRQIKKLWTTTHSLPTLDARVARATQILEARTGKKARTVEVAPSKAATSTKKTKRGHSAKRATSAVAVSAIRPSGIKVPSNYHQHPFTATYTALLPQLQSIPATVRMAHVAKAWTSTDVKNDHRSPKQRIAAVARALKA